MKTRQYQITLQDITADIERKPIKNLYLRVYPPDGRVYVSVPRGISEDAVRTFLTGRLEWIRRQQERILSNPIQPRPQVENGACHYFLGQPCLLRIIEHDGPEKVMLRDQSNLDLFVRPDATVEQKERLLLEWYRAQLRQMIPPLIMKWEPVLGVKVAEWGIKRMKTKWGTCNIRARRIWLNLELAKKPAACLEYVVVHEMVHLLERHHNARFKGLMDQFLPGWRENKKYINGGYN